MNIAANIGQFCMSKTDTDRLMFIDGKTYNVLPSSVHMRGSGKLYIKLTNPAVLA